MELTMNSEALRRWAAEHEYLWHRYQRRDGTEDGSILCKFGLIAATGSGLIAVVRDFHRQFHRHRFTDGELDGVALVIEPLYRGGTLSRETLAAIKWYRGIDATPAVFAPRQS
jgi:hypothetical protein